MENKADKQLKFIELRAKGNSFDRISRQNQKEISTLSNIERDALFEAYKMNQKHQIESLGMQLDKIKAELEKRDLSYVSTEKLINLEIRLFENIEKLRTPVILHSEEEAWDISIGSEWEG